MMGKPFKNIANKAFVAGICKFLNVNLNVVTCVFVVVVFYLALCALSS